MSRSTKWWLRLLLLLIGFCLVVPSAQAQDLSMRDGSGGSSAAVYSSEQYQEFIDSCREKIDELNSDADVPWWSAITSPIEWATRTAEKKITGLGDLNGEEICPEDFEVVGGWDLLLDGETYGEVPIEHYTVTGEGGLTSPMNSVLLTLLGLIWGCSLLLVSLTTFIVEVAYEGLLFTLFEEQATEYADLYVERIGGQTGAYFSFAIFLTACYGFYQYVKGKVSTAAREILTSYGGLVIFGLIVAVGGVQTPINAVFAVTQNLSIGIPDVISKDKTECADPPDIEGARIGQGAEIACPFVRKIRFTNVEEPYDLINYGTDLDDPAIPEQCRLARAAALARERGPTDPSGTILMSIAGEECEKYARANSQASLTRFYVAIISAIFSSLNMVAVGSFAFTMLRGEAKFITLIFTATWGLVSGAMPGGLRAGFWGVWLALAKAAGQLFGGALFLTIYLEVTTIVVDSVGDHAWGVKTAILFFVAIAMITRKKRILAKTDQLAERAAAAAQQEIQGNNRGHDLFSAARSSNYKPPLSQRLFYARRNMRDLSRAGRGVRNIGTNTAEMGTNKLLVHRHRMANKTISAKKGGVRVAPKGFTSTGRARGKAQIRRQQRRRRTRNPQNRTPRGKTIPRPQSPPSQDQILRKRREAQLFHTSLDNPNRPYRQQPQLSRTSAEKQFLVSKPGEEQVFYLPPPGDGRGASRWLDQ